ncbi:MAG: Gfo/Idh/MocA family oxidoreductase [Thermomicrobiales bacterium]|nr:Gfo/Idh/MocA family oxidoreductase [Thermomicrobiales bacterium]
MNEAAARPYRAAVIGCGAIGSSIEDDVIGAHYRALLPLGHAPVYHVNPRTELIAGADPSEERRRLFADRWSLAPERVYPDYREMLERERIDIVSVATPTPYHAEVALAAVEAGVKAIFIEKPIASSLADAERLIAACETAGVPLAVNHTRRGDPLHRQAKHLIDEGTLGELSSIVIHGAHQLMWNASHAFDIASYFNGDRSAAWIVGKLEKEPALDPGGTAFIVYENGVHAYINATPGHAHLMRTELYGPKGKIVIGNYELELWRTDETHKRRPLLLHPFPQVLPGTSPMTNLVNELLDQLEGGPEVISNGNTAIKAVELIAALYESSENNNRRVDLPLADRSRVIRSN